MIRKLLARDRRAAVAVMFALTITPVLGFVALAFDVGSAVWARSQLDLAADSAALTAVMTGANDYAANAKTSFLPAQAAGTKRFSAQAGAIPGVTLSSLSVGVTRNGGTVTANVSYTASYATQFARFADWQHLSDFTALPMGGTATISRTNSPFFVIDILMDDSSSMSIAATPADMLTLGNLTINSSLRDSNGNLVNQNQNCAFACHFDAKGGDRQSNDFYGLALANGVPLRISVMTHAVEQVINTVAGSVTAQQFKIGLYSFNASFNTVYSESTDLVRAAAAAGAMTVPVVDPNNEPDTNIPLALSSLAAITPAAGDGSSVSAPRRYLFIVTDGVADYNNSSGGRTLGPLDPAACAALKSKGVQIFTLYTEYYPLVPPNVPSPGNGFYISNVAPFQNQLAPNLQACASSASYAFQATDPASIQAALSQMLALALSAPARFTQ